MLRKKEVFTVITPFPNFIPRKLAIDILHSHSEVINVNPLVLDHKPIPAPRNAASDEYYSTWYEITERIQYIPGLGRMGSGKISFNGCFHDMPWGLQTHIYAPMNVDLKNRYRVLGNQSGVEPPEPQEIGLADLGAPSDGLYLRDDVEIKCNITMMSFVKSQLRSASKQMVARIIKKAELLGTGVLHAMIEDGRIRTLNPRDRTHLLSSPVASASIPSPHPSPVFMDQIQSPGSPGPKPYQIPRPASLQHQVSDSGMAMAANQMGRSTHWSAPYGGIHRNPSQLADTNASAAAPIEMPGDFVYPTQSSQSSHLAPQPSPTYPPSEMDSNVSTRSSPQPNQYYRSSSHQQQQHSGQDWRWSQTSEGSSAGTSAMHSPGLPSGPLPTHSEVPENEQQQQQ
ncbi:hypothetical protein BD289DRAFT_334568, partial [Coniella lustricola]